MDYLTIPAIIESHKTIQYGMLNMLDGMVETWYFFELSKVQYLVIEYPILVKQDPGIVLADVGFRQTLKVRTLGCARSLSLDELTTQKDTGFILVRATIVV